MTSAPAVIPTKPASEPFKIIDKSGFLLIVQEAIIAPIIPAAPANVVVTKTKEIPPGSADRTDPPLNPYQPNHNKKTPIDASGKLCPRMGFIEPSLPYLPIRGPRIIDPIKAAQPPTLWTRVDPAKS